MSELAFLFVRAKPVFDELFAELAFLLVLVPAVVRMVMGMFGGGASKVPGRL